jgi:ABC-type amino acid transport substrate-binding protein
MRQPISTIIIAVILSVFVSFLVLPQGSGDGRKTETAYERVIRTGTLRCGYGVTESLVMRDPNTGEMSGVVYDFMQEVGKALNIKVEYVLEMPWDTIGMGLETKKIDAHCAGVWATPARGRAMEFSNPMFFSPVVAFARADDHRFDNNLDRINQPDITIVVSDDDITKEVYEHDFFNAKKTELAQFSPPEELLLYVATHKADVAVNSPPRLNSFEKGYPGKMRTVPLAKPLRIFPDVIAVRMGEEELLHMLNTAIDQELDGGLMDKLLKKYQGKYDVSWIVPVKRPYDWKSKP